jgi:hypothetical protein
MGGVAEAKEVKKLVEKYDITNCWSLDDWTLSMTNIIELRDVNCIGRQEVPGARNIDLTKKVLGHQEYRKMYCDIIKRYIPQQRLE